jgi:hypothetical protein
MRNRIGAPILLLAAMLFGNAWSIVSWQKVWWRPPHGNPSHRALQCFADGVLAHTKPRDSILFILPEDDSEGGLANHRLRYALPGRYISTNHDLVPSSAPPPTSIAVWRSPAPSGRVIWRGCEGVLQR